ncbi:unnamed protein product [Parascedosporium putredinis]|uniref:1,3-beta-glucanosyltransferase n=1 Tax=Parascedosporium putredinis TaxID=1442378 RepID=A0A9P1H4I2_9PEZI|nr:unnamed protein product [Parascedosporium putredinis]CAI7995705.1 unnamed protein product [Parascedosporium putredinis]
MHAGLVLSGLVALVAATPTVEKQLPNRAASLPAVTASGNAFWVGNERFYIRGIDYQPGGSSSDDDPLAHPDICLRDIAKFKKLGVNTIRVYMVDNTLDHDECMTALAEAGIYLVLDANTPKYSINRKDPFPSYNGAYLQNVFATIDVFQKYDNTLAFFSGNEVINEEPGTTISAPYVKAVTRDMRRYIKERKYRGIPVGYSAADVSENRMQTAHYFNCGPDDTRSDFFAFNDYSWCSSNYTVAGWDRKVANFTGYGLPIFLSEYGCNTNKRDFGEVEALMSSEMTGVYSGGLMYEYTMETNKYGIVKISSSGEVTELDEFANFRSALAKYPAPSGTAGATATTSAVDCPAQDAAWEVDPDILPAMPTTAEKYFSEGAGTGQGFAGLGSQTDWDSGVSAQNITGTSKSGPGAGSGTSEDAAGRLNLGAGAIFVTGGALAFSLFGTLLL